MLRYLGNVFVLAIFPPFSIKLHWPGLPRLKLLGSRVQLGYASALLKGYLLEKSMTRSTRPRGPEAPVTGAPKPQSQSGGADPAEGPEGEQSNTWEAKRELQAAASLPRPHASFSRSPPCPVIKEHNLKTNTGPTLEPGQGGFTIRVT